MSSDSIKKEYMSCIWDYVPKYEDELSFKMGDIISIIERVEDGWYKGMNLRSKEIGMLPSNYVCSVSETDAKAHMDTDNPSPDETKGFVSRSVDDTTVSSESLVTKTEIMHNKDNVEESLTPETESISNSIPIQSKLLLAVTSSASKPENKTAKGPPKKQATIVLDNKKENAVKRGPPPIPSSANTKSKVVSNTLDRSRYEEACNIATRYLRSTREHSAEAVWQWNVNFLNRLLKTALVLSSGNIIKKQLF